MGTAAAGLVVLLVAGLAIRSMIHDKKQGKSIQCGSDCAHCGGGCCKK